MIIGCAIISKDGFLADTRHSMEKILHPVDFGLFQERLDKDPGICVMGRLTSERNPNVKNRMRYVLSTSQEEKKERNERVFPSEAALLSEIDSDRPKVYYILGGGRVYSLFGRRRLYDMFHLSIRKDVVLKNGIAIDSDAPFDDADRLMDRWGLRRESSMAVDDGLDMISYGKKKISP